MDDPSAYVNAALLVLDGALKLIAVVKSQGGLTDDQILEHARATVPENAKLIEGYLASLPPVA